MVPADLGFTCLDYDDNDVDDDDDEDVDDEYDDYMSDEDGGNHFCRFSSSSPASTFMR